MNLLCPVERGPWRSPCLLHRGEVSTLKGLPSVLALGTGSYRDEGASRQGSLASPASPISSVGNGCIYSELRVPVLTPRVPRGSSHCPLRWCPLRWCGWQPGQGTSRPSLHSLSLSTALGNTGPETLRK